MSVTLLIIVYYLLTLIPSLSCVFCLRDVALIVNKLHVWKPLYWYNFRFVHGPVVVLRVRSCTVVVVLRVRSCTAVVVIRKLGA